MRLSSDPRSLGLEKSITVKQFAACAKASGCGSDSSLCCTTKLVHSPWILFVQQKYPRAGLQKNIFSNRTTSLQDTIIAGIQIWNIRCEKKCPTPLFHGDAMNVKLKLRRDSNRFKVPRNINSIVNREFVARHNSYLPSNQADEVQWRAARRFYRGDITAGRVGLHIWVD